MEEVMRRSATVIGFVIYAMAAGTLGIIAARAAQTPPQTASYTDLAAARAQ
jgi:hypothetical protein